MNEERVRNYQHLVDVFREPPRRRPVAKAEKAVVALLLGWVAFSAWAIGLRDVWSLGWAFALAAAAFIAALLPRPHPPLPPGAQPPPGPLRRLVRFAVFWLGGAVLAIIACQGLNPAFAFERTPTRWFLAPLEHVQWLPSGVRSPWDTLPYTTLPQTNPWRVLLGWSGAWLAVCAAWIGLTRRRSCQWMLWGVVLNAVALGLLAVTQRLTGATGILWVYDPPTPSFWATFTYRNQAAAYLNLAFGVALGLAFQSYSEARLAARRSHPGPLWLLVAAGLGLTSVLSASRGGMLFLGMQIVTAAAAALAWLLAARVSAATRVTIAALALLLAGGGAVAFSSLRTPELDRRLQSIFRLEQQLAAELRVHSNRAGWQMFLDRPVYGWGAGSFRYQFPAYQRTIPELARPQARSQMPFWRDVHNDVLQVFIELGIVGGLLAAACGLWWCWRAVVGRGWEIPVVACGLVAWISNFGHAAADFVWQSPAVLGFAALLPAILIRTLEIERSAAPARSQPATQPPAGPAPPA